MEALQRQARVLLTERHCLIWRTLLPLPRGYGRQAVVRLTGTDGGFCSGIGEILDAAGFFLGLIDDVCFYDVVLSTEEIEALAC